MNSKVIWALVLLVAHSHADARASAFSETIARQICEISVEHETCLIKTSSADVSECRSSLYGPAGVRLLECGETAALPAGGVYTLRQGIKGRPAIEIVVTNFVGLAELAQDVSPMFCKTGTLACVRVLFPPPCCVGRRTESLDCMRFVINGERQMYDYQDKTLSNPVWPVAFRADGSNEKRMKRCSMLAAADYRVYQRELGTLCRSTAFESARKTSKQLATNTVVYASEASSNNGHGHKSMKLAQFVVREGDVYVNSIATCSDSGIAMIVKRDFNGIPLVVLHEQADGMWQCSFYSAGDVCAAVVFFDRIRAQEVFYQLNETLQAGLSEEVCRATAGALLLEGKALLHGKGCLNEEIRTRMVGRSAESIQP